MSARHILFLIFLFINTTSLARQLRVVDTLTQDGVPFATVRFGKTSQGIITDLNGYFTLPSPPISSFIEVSAMGYTQKVVALPIPDDKIYLQPAHQTLDEVTIRPPMDKIRHVLNMAIAAKDNNNPDKYERYQCQMYFKMVLDKVLPDSVLNNAEAAKRKNADFFTQQHLLLSETYSVRSWREPQLLQEDVLATRISGLQQAVFTSLVTDVLPFHAYGNFIKINEKDYHNPLSRGFEHNYRFNLIDEILENEDTVWVLSFRPRRNTGNLLSGSIYIHSDGYAISKIIAQAVDTALRQSLRIEQQYSRLPYANGNRWFPARLNYILDMEQKTSSGPYTLHLKGNSQIDSVQWELPGNFSFNKKHTIRLMPGADKAGDSTLNLLRPLPLTVKEKRTYKAIDSLGQEIKADRIMTHLRHLPEGKVSLSIFDADIARVLMLNKYESVRLGLGLQTNEQLLKWLSVGGWGGYGFRDKQWKYGVFSELYLDKYREFVVRAGYADDIADPGRVKLHREIDKGYLRQFLLQRADHVTTYHVSARKKIAYWNIETGAQEQNITPLYTYTLNVDGTAHSRFDAQEAYLNLRYAFGERTVPFFGSYHSLGSKYPIFYGKYIYGKLTSDVYTVPYMQAICAITWQKRINRLGIEQIAAQAGKTWSAAPLPLSKLFAGNGYQYEAKNGLSLYTFGGIMTINPYQYYSDQFVQFIYRHDFEWKLFKLGKTTSPFSSTPAIGLQYGMLYGSMVATGAHTGVAFNVPNTGHHEVGILLNNIIRMRTSIYYYSFNLGFFAPVSGMVDVIENGKVVLGATAEF